MTQRRNPLILGVAALAGAVVLSGIALTTRTTSNTSDSDEAAVTAVEPATNDTPTTTSGPVNDAWSPDEQAFMTEAARIGDQHGQPLNDPDGNMLDAAWGLCDIYADAGGYSRTGAEGFVAGFDPPELGLDLHNAVLTHLCPEQATPELDGDWTQPQQDFLAALHVDGHPVGQVAPEAAIASGDLVCLVYQDAGSSDPRILAEGFLEAWEDLDRIDAIIDSALTHLCPA